MTTERSLTQSEVSRNVVVWLGAATRFTSCDTVSARISDNQLAALGGMIAEHTGEVVPEPAQDEVTRCWRTMEDVVIEVSASNGGTFVQLATDRRQDIATSSVVFVALALVLTIVCVRLLDASGVPAVGGVLAASLGVSWWAFRMYWKRAARSWQHRLDKLGSVMAAKVERLATSEDQDS